jgi:hypothetical protein
MLSTRRFGCLRWLQESLPAGVEHRDESIDRDDRDEWCSDRRSTLFSLGSSGDELGAE